MDTFDESPIWRQILDMAGPIKNTERLVAQRFFALMEGKSSTAGAPSGGGEEACPFRVPQVSLGLLKVKGEETREGGGGIGLNMLLLWGLDLVLPSQSV